MYMCECPQNRDIAPVCEFIIYTESICHYLYSVSGYRHWRPKTSTWNRPLKIHVRRRKSSQKLPFSPEKRLGIQKEKDSVTIQIVSKHARWGSVAVLRHRKQ